jgi:ribosomal protein S18 acetylase RimI-like enzyme
VQKEAAYIVTPAGPSDALALARVHVACWRETYPGLLPQPYLDRMNPYAHAARWGVRLMRAEEITLAAEGREGLVGYCSAEPSRRGGAKDEVEITTLYVLKSAQGESVGYRLMTQTARAFEARGATSLIVWVLKENAKARHFYEAMGGVLAGERSELVGGWAVPSVAYRWGEIGAVG